MDIPKNVAGKVAILLLGSNVPAAVTAHNILGNRSLVGDPTRLMAYKSTVRLQGVVGELNTICGLLIVQVMQNPKRHHNVCVSKPRVSSKRPHVTD